MPAAPFTPVFLGAEIGAYAMARAIHEQWGIRSTFVCSNSLALITHSAIIERSLVADGTDEAQLVARLREIAAAHDGPPLVLLTNSDPHAQVIARRREELAELYIIPSPTREVVERVTDKAQFAEICDELGIPTPRTLVVDVAAAEWAEPDLGDLQFPVIAKPAVSAEYLTWRYGNKKKVYRVDTAEELTALWAELRAAKFPGAFLVQEFIPGDDTANKSITAYADSSGRMTLGCTAHVLLEEHAPRKLGIPAAMYTYRDDELIEQARRFLEHTGFHGFANFDVKVDPRTGRAYFFEVNTRIGRNNYYVTAAGTNPLEFMVADAVAGEQRDLTVVTEQVLYSIVPGRLVLKYQADPELKALARRLLRGRRFHPLAYRKDASLKRRAYLVALAAKYFREYREFYPLAEMDAERAEAGQPARS